MKNKNAVLKTTKSFKVGLLTSLIGLSPSSFSMDNEQDFSNPSSSSPSNQQSIVCKINDYLLNSEYNQAYLTQKASLSILPFWFPWFTKSLQERATVVQSSQPSNSLRIKFSNYRGIMANLPMQLLYPLVKCELTFLENLVRKNFDRAPNVVEEAFMGVIAGASTVILANPYEVTVIRTQLDKVSPRTAFTNVLKEAGIGGLYRGACTMMVRNAAFTEALFFGAPVCSKWLSDNVPIFQTSDQYFGQLTHTNWEKTKSSATIVGSILPAIFASIIYAPIDLGMVMRQADPSCNKFSSFSESIKLAYKHHGKNAFKAGILSRLMATTIEIAGFNIFYNYYSAIDREDAE